MYRIFSAIFFAFISLVINAKQLTNKKFTLVIDAGHGGNDPGCHGNKYNEKDVALAVALNLAKLVEENCKDVKVILTRKTDVFLELNERAKIANDANADLFICIHCNASPNKKVFGSETYVMGLHKTKGNLEVAKRENASILLESDYKKNYDNFDPNSDEANIIFTMFQNAHLDQSLSLADKIQNYYKTKSCRDNKGVKQAGFLVLWKTSMASVLTETGFLTNPQEEMFLGSKKGQEHISASIFLAFRKYKDELNSIKSSYSDHIENINCNELVDIHSDIQNEVDTVTNEKPKHLKDNENVDIKTQPKGSVSKSDSIVQVSRIDTSKQRQVKTEKTKELYESVKRKIVFRVQVYTSDQKLSIKYPKFKPIKHIIEKQMNEEYKYFSGDFSSFAEALEEQNILRKKGFIDSFVVAFENEQKISVKEAIDKANNIK
jgi:N-acetylmuramoyl-L-alanine amidase